MPAVLVALPLAAASARALTFEPSLVLLDEPMGAPDRQPREDLQGEIRRRHHGACDA